MTNYEHYEEEIKKFTRLSLDFGLNKDDRKIVKCSEFDCLKCAFYVAIGKGCSNNKLQWVDEEYIEPHVDWSKVPVDTKIWVREGESFQWRPRYFSKYEDGQIYAWDDGGTSFTAIQSTSWRFAKLAEEAEECQTD